MKKIYVIHENSEWLIPLLNSFKKMNAPFVEWHMDKVNIDFKKLKFLKKLILFM